MATDAVGMTLPAPAAQSAQPAELGLVVRPAWPESYEATKRVLDVAFALLMLLCLSPLLALCAAAVAFETGLPVLFRQERIGRHGRRFTLLKFRSMKIDADADVHRRYITAYIAGQLPPQSAPAQGSESAGPRPVYKLTQDPRVTRVGALLRRTSMDELPQLWNVLRGEMSLVGPRPPVAYEVEQYKPSHLRRLDVQPGLTGLWQVRGRGRTTFEEMVAMDVDYIARRSLSLDVQIILRTLPAVLLRKGAH
ncbi:MAG TPA: sugar transferase [Chloroflexota bacterium]|nr:sugar transferase [Chloroflexota bacterium]